jgi:hypothetical protein
VCLNKAICNSNHVPCITFLSEHSEELQCIWKVAVHLGYSMYICLSVSKLPPKCAVVSLYKVVKQRLKCTTGKVCNFLIQFLLTMVLSIEERVFLVEHVFREGNRDNDLVQEQFVEKFPETPVPHRNAVRGLTIRVSFCTVCYILIHTNNPCRVGPSTPDLWCISVATQASCLYLLHF